jgi:hypothetical protein
MASALASSASNEAITDPATAAQAAGFAPGDPGHPDFELGLQTLADAQQLGDAVDSSGSALLLYRATVLLFLNARLARAPAASASDTPADRWALSEQFPEVRDAVAQLTFRQATLVREAISTDSEETHAARWSSEDRQHCQDGLRRVALALGDALAVEAGRGRRRLFVRRLKIGVLSLCLLLPATYALLKKPNLALHRPVVVTSRSPEHGVDPSRVVDGKRTNLGFHTQDGGQKSVTVDLGRVASIQRVDVFNRSDCCGERAVPLTLEVSADGKSFRTVLLRIDNFSLWKAEFPATEARYVRLTQTGNAAFHLSEIEVY